MAESKSAIGEAPALDLPIKCKLRVDCWLINLVDHDPSTGVQDFRCSNYSYDGHKGTDIAIRDLRTMERGVPVLASAPGEVIATRDGMLDQMPSVDFRKLKNNFCGNRVIIRHKNGWETQYCHLRRDSVLVERGQKVTRGQILGLVGHSGMTMFPHVHLSVRHHGKVIDPFVGVSRTQACKPGDFPLWRPRALLSLSQDMTAIYNVGFSSKPPDLRLMPDSNDQSDPIVRASPALIIWAEIFWVQPNDMVRLRIFGPKDEIIVDSRTVIKKRQAWRKVFSGRKKRGFLWPEGQYRGEVLIEREEDLKNKSRYRVESKIELR